MEALAFWTVFWTAVAAVVASLAVIGSLFAFIRRNDMSSLTDRLDDLSISVNKKLDEAEFRRHEEREDAQLRAMVSNNNDNFDKLYAKIDKQDIKLDRLYELLLNNK